MCCTFVAVGSLLASHQTRRRHRRDGFRIHRDRAAGGMNAYEERRPRAVDVDRGAEGCADGSRGGRMRLTLTLLGWELYLTLGPETTAETSSLDGGTTASTPVGFTPSWPDQRWERGTDHGAGEPED